MTIHKNAFQSCNFDKLLHIFNYSLSPIEYDILWTQSLILHKMLIFTGTLNLNRFKENCDAVATNEFRRV